MDVLRFPPWHFDLSKNEWTTAGSAVPSQPRGSIRLATFNVWFEDYELDVRCDAMLRLLHECGADIIALQEVTAPFLKHLLQEEWVRRDFAVSDATGTTIPDYGVLLLSRLPVRRFELHDLPTTMSRKLLLGQVKTGTVDFSVGAVHLESLKEYGLYREEQLREVFRILESYESAILMGDFNFCSTSEENSLIDDRYTDLWPLLFPDDPGWTVDGNSNTMRRALGKSGKPVRFDRILIRTARGALKLQSIGLLGTNPISPARPEVFPSDHFGVTATLKIA